MFRISSSSSDTSSEGNNSNKVGGVPINPSDIISDDSMIVYDSTTDKWNYIKSGDIEVDNYVKKPLDSKDESVARFNGTSGDAIKGSNVIISDTGEMNIAPELEGSGTIPSNTNLYLSAPTGNTNVTKNIAVHIEDQSSISGERYGIYQEGTTDSNFFAGSVGIGKTPTESGLLINNSSNDARGGALVTLRSTRGTPGLEEKNVVGDSISTFSFVNYNGSALAETSVGIGDPSTQLPFSKVVTTYDIKTHLAILPVTDSLSQIYISTDTGATWTHVSTIPTGNWKDVYVQRYDTGTGLYKMLVVGYESKFWQSYNSGSSWSSVDSTPGSVDFWESCCISDDGNIQCAVTRISAGNKIITAYKTTNDWISGTSILPEGVGNIASLTPYVNFASNSTTGNSLYGIIMKPNGAIIGGDSLATIAYVTFDGFTTVEKLFGYGTYQYNGFDNALLSEDGKIMLGVRHTSRVVILALTWTSSETWSFVQNTLSVTISDVAVVHGTAMSGDGTTMVVITSIDSSGTIILKPAYISRNTGVTWDDTSLPAREWRGCAMSRDGNVITIIANNDRINVSVDAGVNWAQYESKRDWNTISMDPTGQYQLATTNSEGVFYSIDSGSTWVQQIAGVGGGLIKFKTAVDEDSSLLDVLTCDNKSNVVFGPPSFLETTATDGFVHIPATLDVPSGTPSLYTGKAPMVYDEKNSKLMVYNGTSWTNTGKTFIINHPLDEKKFLIHGCLEGPELGVYYRGESKIAKDSKFTEISLPDYVDSYAVDFTVHIAPIWDPNNPEDFGALMTTKVKNGKFKVYGSPRSFNWVVYGKRQNIITEPYKSDINVYGDGPYKWYSSK